MKRSSKRGTSGKQVTRREGKVKDGGGVLVGRTWGLSSEGDGKEEKNNTKIVENTWVIMIPPRAINYLNQNSSTSCESSPSESLVSEIQETPQMV